MDSLTVAIEDHLAPQGFRGHWRPRMADLGLVAFWRRCTWNTNRAVAVVRSPSPVVDLRGYCQRLKWTLLRQTRFVPFLYELGLQLVVITEPEEGAIRPGEAEDLTNVVDRISNQFVVLQSLFVVNLTDRRYSTARTSPLSVTVPVLDAIELGIEAAGFQPRNPRAATPRGLFGRK